MNIINKNYKLFTIVCLLSFFMTACDDGDHDDRTPPVVVPPDPPADVTVSGVVQDGGISGGTIYVFSADDIESVLADANDADDRSAALAAASPLVSQTIAAGDEFSLALSGELAGDALVLVYDNTDAEDESFGVPLNLLTVFVLAGAGEDQVLNMTTHTTVIANQVIVALDPDNDGMIISAADFESELTTATNNVLMVLASNDDGEALLDDGVDPQTTSDAESIADASEYLGQLIRDNAAILGADGSEVMTLLAADAADGVLDGVAGSGFDLDQEQLDDLTALAETAALGKAQAGDMVALSCSAAASALRRACEYEILDEYFELLAKCADTSSITVADECEEEANEEFEEVLEECGAVTEARQNLCVALGDAIHDPEYGEEFAGNFVDPLEIGGSVMANTWLPLVQGNVWTYQGTFEEDGEMITETIVVTVTDKTKHIDGITCLVVNDVVSVDGELVEDTDDWFAQDLDGNVWYCGEEAKDYEYFEGDSPEIPELVAIDGSFKAGRDGDEAGLLMPNTTSVGSIYRQEVSVANAEDVIEVLALDANESSMVATCSNDCLQTYDFSPLDPEAQEHKFYKPGIGMIVEVDLNTGDRVELVAFTQAP